MRVFSLPISSQLLLPPVDFLQQLIPRLTFARLCCPLHPGPQIAPSSLHPASLACLNSGFSSFQETSSSSHPEDEDVLPRTRDGPGSQFDPPASSHVARMQPFSVTL